MKIETTMNKIFKLFCAGLVCCGISAGFTGCSTDDDPVYLDEVQVSTSYVAIPQNGGSTTITIDATGEWAFATQRWIAGKDTTNAAAPKWLTLSATNGAAGQSQVTFSAESTLDGRTCELLLECGGKTQRVNVIQGLSTVSEASCADVIAGPDSKTYRVKGTVTSIANTTYGNWYLKDETGEIYIYGTLDKNGNTKNFLSLGIDVGDEVTVEGPKTTYNGTVELVDVTVVKIEKSLIKVDSISSTEPIPAEGGEVTVKLEVKGLGFLVDIPQEAKSWLVMSSMGPGEVTFRALPNEGDLRKTTITFSTTDGNKTYTAQTVISQEAMPDAPGSEAKPFSIEEAIAKCKEIGATASDQVFYAKGRISSIKEVSTKYGNATFNISDDGQDVNFLTCYRSNSLNNEKFAAEDEIAVGDEVLMCGKLVNYTDKDGVTTPQFAQGCYIVSIKKGNAAGTLAKPFTPAEANAFCLTLGEGGVTEDDYYVKGKIIEITEKNQFNTQYGNCTFYISADGTDSGDKFYVYRTLYLGNEKYSDDTKVKPQAGDEVVICGKLMLYKDKDGNLVPETSQNKTYIYSLNGKTE